MMKKSAILVSVMAVLLSLLMMVPTSVSAAQVLTIEDDFISYTDGDTGELSMAKIFAMESGSKVRIKYAFGKGYCCPTGGGETASLVYKVDANGGSFSKLGITVKAHFASRANYSEDWKNAPKAYVEVSTDGTAYTKVATWDGEQVDSTLGQNDYKDLTAKTYTADLKSAAGSASTLYVRLSWEVFDYPLYSSVHNVKIEGEVSGGNGVAQATTTTTTTTTAAPTTTTTTAAGDDTTTTAAGDDTTTTTAADAGTTTAGDDTTTTTTAADTAAGDGDEPTGGFPVGVIVAIVVVLVLVAAGAIVFLLYKKGTFNKN